MRPGTEDILMIGTPLEGRGGMSSVVAAYRDGGCFERCGIRYLTPVAAGGPLAKLWRALAVWTQTLGLLATGRVRLLHIHAASGVSFWRKSAFCWLGYLFRRPVILHVHGGNFAAFCAASPAPARRYIAATLGRATRVAVLSPVWIDRIRAIAPAARCVVLDNPVHAWPASLGRAIGPVHFLFLGRLERDKGIYELVVAFSRLPGDCRLLLGGDGETAAVRDLAVSLDVADRVEFLGWVSGSAKQLAFARADVFVLPSRIEGLPIAMLEAMHCGLPVVTCPVGSIPEAVTHGREALLVPPADTAALAAAMVRLAGDPPLRRRMGLQGRATFLARYSIDSVAPRLESLYQEALQ